MREQSAPRLLDRRVREDWASAGSSDMYSRARAKANDILESHHPEPLPDEVAAQIRTIVVGAEQELGVATTT